MLRINDFCIVLSALMLLQIMPNNIGGSSNNIASEFGFPFTYYVQNATSEGGSWVIESDEPVFYSQFSFLKLSLDIFCAAAVALPISILVRLILFRKTTNLICYNLPSLWFWMLVQLFFVFRTYSFLPFGQRMDSLQMLSFSGFPIISVEPKGINLLANILMGLIFSAVIHRCRLSLGQKVGQKTVSVTRSTL